MGDWLRSITSTPFGQIVLTANVLAAALSAIATIASFLLTRAWRRKLLNEVQEHEFQEVLSSDNILSLGQYLDDNLGGIPIRAYVQDRALAARFDHLLARLSEYVGTTEGVREEQVTAPGIAMAPEPVPTPEIAPVVRELETGERWNALAKLRRLLEQRLREYLATAGVPTDQRRSAGQMVRLAERYKLLDESMSHQLRYAIGVANRAVHGEDVSSGEAQEAIGVAQHALDNLKRLSRPVA
jgi:hypothetical protein